MLIFVQSSHDPSLAYSLLMAQSPTSGMGQSVYATL